MTIDNILDKIHMNPSITNAFNWFFKRIYKYNLFIKDEEEYNDDTNNNEYESVESSKILQKQLYETRLYIVFLLSKR